jgi:EthD domain
MYKLMAFIARKEGTTKEAFRDYYEEFHTLLIAEIAPPMKAYRRNYVNLSAPFMRCEDQIDFDVVTEMEFDDQDECQRWFDAFRDPDSFALVAADEQKFIDVERLRVCVVDVAETG